MNVLSRKEAIRITKFLLSVNKEDARTVEEWRSRFSELVGREVSIHSARSILKDNESSHLVIRKRASGGKADRTTFVARVLLKLVRELSPESVSEEEVELLRSMVSGVNGLSQRFKQLGEEAGSA